MLLHQTIADRIVKCLVGKGLSAVDASLRSGLDRNTITDILDDKVDGINLEHMAAISQTLGCSVEYLLGGNFPANGVPVSMVSVTVKLDARQADIIARTMLKMFNAKSSFERYELTHALKAELA